MALLNEQYDNGIIKGLLAKNVNNNPTPVYPQSSADLIEFEDTTVLEKIKSMDTSIDDIKVLKLNRTLNTGKWYCTGFMTHNWSHVEFSIPMEIESAVSSIAITEGSIKVIRYDSNAVIIDNLILEKFSNIKISKSDLGLSFDFTLNETMNNGFSEDMLLDTPVAIQLNGVKLVFS